MTYATKPDLTALPSRSTLRNRLIGAVLGAVVLGVQSRHLVDRI